ncbi:MAG: TIR domain-containing protein [Ruminococcaceae bacterium]|nr:TIR domain-containing protein [Oscillospiraceae bacterium]
MMKLYSYNGNEPYIFISYAHKDNNTVYPVIDRMQRDGYRVWFDEGIDPGTEWDETIAEKIDGCGYFVAFISNNYIDSANCKDELKYARDLGKKSVLIYLEDVILTKGMAMRMNRIQSIFKHKYDDEEEFYRKFYTSDGIDAFTSKGGAVRDEEDADDESEAVSEEEKPARKTIKFPSGSTYTGEVNESGQMHGSGVYNFANGDVYEGSFENGTLSGKGKYSFASGIVYEGEMSDNKFNGKGTYRFTDGDVYEGDFKDSKRHGKGIYRYASGTVYEGELSDGKFNGHGVYRFYDGNYYEGDMKDDKLCGKGVYRFKNGDVYEGEFKDNKIDGKGIFRSANGKVFEGEFKDGKYIG